MTTITLITKKIDNYMVAVTKYYSYTFYYRNQIQAK